MVARVRIGRHLKPIEEQWLVQKVGPRLHYFPKSIGGVGWIAKCEEETIATQKHTGKALIWYVEFEDDKLASYFALKFL